MTADMEIRLTAERLLEMLEAKGISKKEVCIFWKPINLLFMVEQKFVVLQEKFMDIVAGDITKEIESKGFRILRIPNY